MTQPNPQSTPSDAAAKPQEATQRPQAETPTQSMPAPQSIPTLLAITIGSTLGPYRLIEKLGEGGMGAVYKAQHKHLGKTVAVKILPSHFTANADAVARFRREMKAVGKVEHPNIVRAMDAGEIGGVHYLAMEYVAGSDLSAVVQQRGPLSVVNACKVIRQIALALKAAHAAGLVHRDIKPSNMLLSNDGHIKLLDLGLARLAEDAGATQGLTAAGQSFGTPDYMAPEQWDDAHGVDARCDLYALGCTLYYLIHGRAPFAAQMGLTQKLKAHAMLPPPDLRAALAGPGATGTSKPAEPHKNRVVPDELVSIYERLMAKSPDERFASAGELVVALDAVIAAVKSRPASRPTATEELFPSLNVIDAPQPAVKRTKRRRKQTLAMSRRLLYTLIGGAAVVIAGIVIIITRSDGTTVRIPVEPGDRVEIVTDDPEDAATPDDHTTTDGDSSTGADYTAEREVAEWVLSIGGTVHVRINGSDGYKVIRQLPLPDQPFHVQKVYLESNSSISDADLARFHALTGVEQIDLTDNRQITDAGAAELARVPSLQNINLQHTEVTDAGLARLVQLPDLRAITLTNTRVTDAGIKLLASAPRLEKLEIIGLLVTIEGLRALRGLPLSTLGIDSTQVRYADLPEVTQLFPGLKALDGRRLQGAVGAGLWPLAQLAGLEELSVMPEQVLPGPPHHLEQFPRLRRLTFIFTPFPAGLAARLEQLPGITELRLQSPTFESGAYAELCANTTLERLHLVSWSGGDAELLQLVDMQKLRELSLQGTQITAVGAQAFHELRPDVAITGDFNIPAEP